MDEFLYSNWLFATDIELIEDEIDIDTAVNKLKDLPYEDLGYANIVKETE